MTLNFVAGTSVIIGGMISTAIDASDGDLGIILAFGGGTYLYLACCECVPNGINFARKDMKENNLETLKVAFMYLFGGIVLGSVLIGIVLTNHEHCAADGGHAH